MSKKSKMRRLRARRNKANHGRKPRAGRRKIRATLERSSQRTASATTEVEATLLITATASAVSNGPRGRAW